MKISVIGSGYVGTTTALCLAELGHEIIAIDIDKSIVETLNKGKLPFHEVGLTSLLEKHVHHRFNASTDYASILDTTMSLLCLPTPSNNDGSIDLLPIKDAADSIGKLLKEKTDPHYIVGKSTVIPGTMKTIGEHIAKRSGKKLGKKLHLLYNPEFLREGKARYDFMHPDKLVIGGEKSERGILREVYTDLIPNTKLVETDIRTAEMIKYANNAFLATKISFANEMGNICKQFGIDSYEVMDAVGLDHRIERQFLNAGAGFGGSCFPKDVQAIKTKAEDLSVKTNILDATLQVNKEQPLRMIKILEEKIGKLNGKTIAVLGLAFKPRTNDIRNSRSIPVIKTLKKHGATIYAHDPKANQEMIKHFPNISYTDTAEAALQNADACLLMTAWPQYEDLKIEVPCIEGRRLNKGEGICW